MIDAGAHGPENQRTQAESTGSVEPSGRADPAPATTRRGFVHEVGKKALYITPVMLTLTASQAMAIGSPSCKPVGSPCTVPGDCCEFLGAALDCDQSVCCVAMGNPCNVDADCCSNMCTGGPTECTG